MSKDGSSSAASRDAAERPAKKGAEKGDQRIYYDMASGGYWGRNSHSEYAVMPTRVLNVVLARSGFSIHDKDIYGVTDMDAEVMRITQEQSVQFAGAVGGFPVGRYEMLGSRVLVTRGPNFIKPKEGKFHTFDVFLERLLGDQARYFCGWLKNALTSLGRGLPWAPGQMLAIAGPAGSGKSVLQSLITDLLGGRMSNPYEFMTKGTPFNSDVFGAEHALIGDQNHRTDYASRRNFGSAVKNLVVNPEQYVRGMYKAPITLLPFLRLTLTLNDNPEALAVLPPLDSDVADKIILLHAAKADIPIETEEFPTFVEWRRQVVSELPAFLYWLRGWRIPESIRCKRYGVTSYHDAELVDKVFDLSPETRLWQLMETYLFTADFPGEWKGTSSDLQAYLENACKGRETRTVLPYSSACGQYLAKLAHRFALEAKAAGPDEKPAVVARPMGKNRTEFTIRKENAKV